MGWLLFPTPEKWGAVDVSDLKKDTVVVWQDKYYVPLAGMVSMLFPSMVAHVGWNDWQGGLLYAGAIRVYLGLHFTFLVNSLAHWMGDQPYGDKFTPRQNLLVAIITCGEGYHNFHHVFPSDYRNGVHWYDLDPTKWFIWSCEQLRLASQLSRIPDREIEYARNLMLRMSCAGPDAYTIPLDSPTMTWEEFERQAKAGRCLVCIAGFVYDLIDFMHDHPGGPKLIQQVVGKEATSVFYEEFHHSPHATNLLASMRIATIHIGRSRNKSYRMTNT
jgi:stearoyl-CoA desaturase (delta-9 desaturase)